MTKSPKKVAVLIGGWNAEREVSLISGASVCKALEALGHEVLAIDVQHDAQGLIGQLTQQAGGKPSIIFNALHGRIGEDGTMQGFLDIIGIPYTHSGVLASAIAMDKPLMKSVVSGVGVPCPEGKTVSREDIIKNGYPMEPPFVIKPTNEGSSVGVRLVKTKDNISEIEEDGWIYGDKVLIEKYISGHELTVAVLTHKDEAKALTVTELRPRHQEFYDYTAKYTDDQTDHLIPAPIPEEIAAEAMRLAALSCQTIGCNGAARVDFRWDDTKEG
ncbi:MAG TPA: D-alanine--D-alanine ligase, partial [Rhodospirillaceae bacterium]|nr:D-alanine--D-alanine ligase [Rhodospirillaceae bacterium]